MSNGVNVVNVVAGFTWWAAASSVCWWCRVGIHHATISWNSRPHARRSGPAD